MNFLDLIRERWPGASEKDAESLLWMTPYPFVSVEKIAIFMDEMKTKWGDSIQAVMDGAMAEFDADWVKYRESEASKDAIP